MSSLVADKLRLFLSEQFLESFNEAGSSATNQYLFIGRSITWGTGDPTPATIADYRKTELEAWDYMLGAKRINAGNVTHVIPRINWTSGTIYTEYDDEVETLLDDVSSANPTTSFYVLTNERHVYKCISNNNGAASTQKPDSTGTTIFLKSDGYLWKYMYTVSEGNQWLFMDDEYIPWIPVKRLKVDPGISDNYYNQWTTQQAAIKGGIHHYIVTSGASNYGASPHVTITGDGTGATASATVVGGVVTKLTAVNAGSGYTWANVTISDITVSSSSSSSSSSTEVSVTSSSSSSSTVASNTSSSSSTIASVTSSVSSSSTIASVTSSSSSSSTVASVTSSVSSSSSSSTVASVTSSLTSVSSSSSSSSSGDASARAVISPTGGHGANPVLELGGYNILLSMDIDGTELSTLPTNQDYRQIGILRDPMEYDEATVAVDPNYRQTTLLTVIQVPGTNFVDDDVVYQGASLATATATGRAVTWTPLGVAGSTLTVTFTRGTWANGAIIHGVTSGATYTLNATTGVTTPELEKGSGHLLYLNSRAAIQRTATQAEQLRVILDF